MAMLAVPGIAQAADRDGDGLPDRWERRHHLSTSAASANADPDGDRVDNGNEFRQGTKPRDRDSDEDGRRDGREDRDRDGLNNAGEDLTANDPTDRDTDGDGIPDGREQAGVVSAYEDGQLTIDLANGSSITAAVTDRTRVQCSSEEVAEEEQEESPADETSDEDEVVAGASHRGGAGGPRGGRGGRGGCDGFDGRDECPEGTLAVGAAVHEAVIRHGWDGPEYVEIEVLTD